MGVRFGGYFFGVVFYGLYLILWKNVSCNEINFIKSVYIIEFFNIVFCGIGEYLLVGRFYCLLICEFVFW